MPLKVTRIASDQPSVMLSTFQMCSDALVERGVSLADIAAHTGIDEAALSSGRGRVSWDQYRAAMTLVASHCGGPEGMRRLGHTVEEDAVSVRMAALFQTVTDGRVSYQICFRWAWPLFFSCLSFVWGVEGPRTMWLEARLPSGYPPCRPWFHMAQGVLERLPRLIHLGDSAVEVVLAEDGCSARYRIHHVASRTLWFKLRRALKAIFSPNRISRELQAQVEDMDHQLRELIEARRAAEAALVVKDRFLTNISHELRTPLAGAMGLHEVLAETDLSPEQRAVLARINSSHRDLLRQVELLMDVSLLQPGRDISPSFEPLDASRVLSRACAGLAGVAAEKGLHLQLLDHLPASLRLVGDARLLGRVIHELARNAVVFTVSGTVTIDAAYTDGGVLRVTVTDTGPGMSAEQREQALGVFEQLDGSLRRANGGLGVGLTLAQSLAAALGGALDIDSVVGEGTCCTLVLPMSVAPSGRLPLRGDTVLVVDDNSINRLVLSHVVRSVGLRVVEAEDGQEAVAAVSSAQPSVILMDCQMPVMDGFEATRQIRQLPAGSSPYIVAVTAHAQPGYASRCHAAGMDAYLPKPVDRAVLEALLRQVLPLGARADGG